MISKNLLLIATLGLSGTCFAEGVTQSQLAFDNKLVVDGSTVVDVKSAAPGPKITREYYGADSNGFSELPGAALVTPLSLGLVKLGGNLHSVYNWKYDAYFDQTDNGIFYVYSPLERRLRHIQSYKSSPMFQVNMLGWQPDMDASGKLEFQQTAGPEHAADAITFINGEKQLGLQHIVMGNEPFDAMDVHGKEIPSADEYIEKFIKYAMAVREAQEKVSGNSNDIKLWGPEIASGWNAWQTTHPTDCRFDGEIPEKYRCSYGDGEFNEFMPYFLSRIADFERDTIRNPKRYKMLDFISFHYYPLFRKSFKDPGSIITNTDGSQNVAGMLEAVNLWDSESYINKYDYSSPRGVAPKLINKFKSWRARFYPSAKIALTEYGVDSVPNIAYHPIVRPLYLADLLARVGGAGVDTFIHSFLQNGNNINSWEMINGGEKTKLYNVFAMFSNNFLGKVLPSNDSYGDKVNTYSVKTETGTNVFLVNKDSKAHSTDLSFKKGIDVLRVTQVNLPAWSVTLLKVPDARNGTIGVEQYGAKEMGIPVSLK